MSQDSFDMFPIGARKLTYAEVVSMKERTPIRETSFDRNVNTSDIGLPRSSSTPLPSVEKPNVVEKKKNSKRKRVASGQSSKKIRIEKKGVKRHQQDNVDPAATKKRREEKSVDESRPIVSAKGKKRRQFGGGPKIQKIAHFPTAEEEKYFEKHVALSTVPSQTRRSAAFVSVDHVQMKLKDLSTYTQERTLHHHVGKCIDIFIRTQIKQANGDLKKTKYWLTTDHPGYDAKPFHVTHKTYASVNGNDVVTSIARHIQSNKTIKLDDGFGITMNIFKERTPNLRGMGVTRGSSSIKNKVLEFFFGEKNNRVCGETHCLPKSLALGKLFSDIRREKDEDEVKRLKDTLRTATRLDRSTQHREHLQLKTAKDLLSAAAMDPEQKEHSNDDLEKLAAHLADYQIVLWSLEGKEVVPTEVKRFNPDGDGFIGLFLHNEHYEFVTHTLWGKPARFCHKCSTFNDDPNHYVHCRAKCRRCGSTECVQENENIYCDKCNIYFRSQICYDNHLIGVSGKTLPHCEKYFKCKQCLQFDRTDKFRGSPHICGATTFCRVCKCKAGRFHQCKHAMPTAKQIAMKRERQKTWKCIVYDTECITAESGTYSGPVNRGPRHVPNVICARMFCSECRGADGCETCRGPWQYTYQDPVPYGPYQTKEEGIFYVEERHDPMARFARYLLTNKNANESYVIAHNGGSYDHPLLLAEIDRQAGVHTESPKVILQGLRIITADFKCGNQQLYFRDSLQFLQMPLSKMPKAFGLEGEAKGFFPHLFNHPDNYDKNLDTLPPKEYYDPEFMNVNVRQEFEAWYEKQYHTGFKLHDELLKYCHSDVRILMMTLNAFIQMCENTFNDWNPLVNASTLASYVMFVLKNELIRDGDVGYIPENGYGRDSNSALALKYIQWRQKRNPKETIQYMLKGGEKEIAVKGHQYHVDGYIQATNTVIEVNGCVFHGCPRCFPQRDTVCPADPTKTMEALYARTMERAANIESAGYKLEAIWECDIDSQLRSDKKMKKFFNLCKYTRRLQPRDGLCGGRTQVFRSRIYNTTKYVCEYWDFTSMYPYLNAGGAEYPRGNPTVITDGFPSVDGKCPLRGIIYCDVLPKQDAEIGLLPKNICSKLMFPLCRTCAEDQNVTGLCNHVLVSERYLTGVWYSEELNYAVERGYKILKYHEIYYWPDSQWYRGGFFADYIKPLLAMKHQATGYPRGDMTEEEKEKYVADIEKKDGVNLDRTKMEKNPALRSLTKLLMNSAWGKFAQNPLKTQTKIINTSDAAAITEFFNDPKYEPSGMVDYGEHKLFISRTPKRETLESSGYLNLAIAIITTAAARLRLLDAIERVGVKNMVYCDTDSLIFRRRKGTDPLGDLKGDQLGYLTNEIEDGKRLTAVVAIAPKVYALKKKDNLGKASYSVKAKGFKMSCGNANKIHFKSMMRQMVEFDAKGEAEAIEGQAMTFKRGEHALDGLWTYKHTKKLRPVMDKGHYRAGRVTPFGHCPAPYLIDDYPF